MSVFGDLEPHAKPDPLNETASCKADINISKSMGDVSSCRVSESLAVDMFPHDISDTLVVSGPVLEASVGLNVSHIDRVTAVKEEESVTPDVLGVETSMMSGVLAVEAGVTPGVLGVTPEVIGVSSGVLGVTPGVLSVGLECTEVKSEPVSCEFDAEQKSTNLRPRTSLCHLSAEENKSILEVDSVSLSTTNEHENIEHLDGLAVGMSSKQPDTSSSQGSEECARRPGDIALPGVSEGLTHGPDPDLSDPSLSLSRLPASLCRQQR